MKKNPSVSIENICWFFRVQLNIFRPWVIGYPAVLLDLVSWLTEHLWIFQTVNWRVNMSSQGTAIKPDTTAVIALRPAVIYFHSLPAVTNNVWCNTTQRLRTIHVPSKCRSPTDRLLRHVAHQLSIIAEGRPARLKIALMRTHIGRAVSDQAAVSAKLLGEDYFTRHRRLNRLENTLTANCYFF